MIAVDVGAGGVFQVILFHISKNLLPSGQILHQTVESFEGSQSNEGVNEALFCVSIRADQQDQIEGSQIGDQENEMGNRLVRGEADCIASGVCGSDVR